jgi:hypothetical protein
VALIALSVSSGKTHLDPLPLIARFQERLVFIRCFDDWCSTHTRLNLNENEAASAVLSGLEKPKGQFFGWILCFLWVLR